MIITLTVEQAEALDNPLFDEDDALREYPRVLIGNLGVVLNDPEDENSGIAGYVMADPDLVWEDEIVLHTILDERAAILQSIKDAPQADRAGMRSDIRREIRQDARKEARREARQEDRKAARVQLRQELRQEERIAARIEARRLEREAEMGEI